MSPTGCQQQPLTIKASTRGRSHQPLSRQVAGKNCRPGRASFIAGLGCAIVKSDCNPAWQSSQPDHAIVDAALVASSAGRRLGPGGGGALRPALRPPGLSAATMVGRSPRLPRSVMATSPLLQCGPVLQATGPWLDLIVWYNLTQMHCSAMKLAAAAGQPPAAPARIGLPADSFYQQQRCGWKLFCC